MYEWLVFLHVAGSFGFILAHGAAAAVIYALRRERSPERVKALLELSSSTVNVLSLALLTLLAGGVWAGFIGRFWGQGWIWLALGLLIAMAVAMFFIGTRHFGRLRQAVGLPFLEGGKVRDPRPPVSAAELEVLL